MRKVSEKSETADKVIDEDMFPEAYLLKSQFPELKKQSKDDLLLECTMWRKLWAWIPSEMRYYFARTGVTVGIVMRNYHRHIGTLLSTNWTLNEMELGVYEKAYDTSTGKYFWETKIIKVPIGNIITTEWISKREVDEELAEPEPSVDENPSS